MSDLSGDMALFLWFVLSEPVIAAIAGAAAIVAAIVISTYFNFLLSKRNDLS